MKNIVVPTDFSQNARNAVEYAISLFSNVPCNFYLLHVADLSEAPVAVQSFALPSLETGIPSKTKLSHLLQQLQQQHGNAIHQFLAIREYGSLIDCLRRTVENKNIDLVVMGTKGATGLKKLIIGSNSGDVLTKVHCDTLVIPENAHFAPPKQVVFPTDFTIFYSHQILATISELLHMSHAHISVLHVPKSGGRLNNLQERNRSYLLDYLEETSSSKSSFHIINDKKVAGAIQYFAETREVDMIIMVAKNLNFLQQIFFDSTIERLSFHTFVPFMVLHE